MPEIKNAIDADRVKLFPKAKQAEYQRQCHEWDGGANDAELVAEMRRSGDLKSVAIPAIPSVRTAQSDDSLPPQFVRINGRIYHKSKVPQ